MKVPTSYDPLNLYKGSRKRSRSDRNGPPLEKPRNHERARGHDHEQRMRRRRRRRRLGRDGQAHADDHDGRLRRAPLDPFQPFGGEFELCVYASPNTYTRKFENNAESAARNPDLPRAALDPGQGRDQGQTGKRRKSGQNQTGKRRKRSEDQTRRRRSHGQEKSRRKRSHRTLETWASEEKAKKITNAERKAKETAQRPPGPNAKAKKRPPGKKPKKPKKRNGPRRKKPKKKRKRPVRTTKKPKPKKPNTAR